MHAVELENLSYIYFPGTVYEKMALANISLTVSRGELLGIVGANGSGKSTLLQHLNGLLTPARGSVKIFGRVTSDKQYRNELWKEVGLVFQYPEQQLFEATVFDEVSYGPRNLGLNSAEIERRVLRALQDVGLDPTAVFELSPVTLSGGIRRRVAIASVLALQPKILVLDEPTAGLDPLGRETVLEVLTNLRRAGVTVVMVSHNLKEVLAISDKIAFLVKGALVDWGTPRELVGRQGLAKIPGIALPDYLQVIYGLAEGNRQINTWVTSLTEVEDELDRLLRRVNI